MNAEYPQILLLGNPLLRKVSESVIEFNAESLLNDLKSLHSTLARFRQEQGFGRGMAAPQLGILKRVVALNLNDRQTTMINPEITWSSPEEFALWDDCMCFPDLLVRVKRHNSISVQFHDEFGRACIWDNLDPTSSELLQHEIDHLNGILAIDRAIDKESLSYRVNVESSKKNQLKC